MSNGRLVAFFIFIAVRVFAAGPALTTIQDTLYKADGTRMNATAVITWNSFESSDTSAIGMQTLTTQIVNGALYVQLVPNTTANPNYAYTVTYSSDGMIQFQETWMVPPSTSPLRVRDVRTSSTTVVPSSGGSGNVSGGSSGSGPIAESSVTGLPADLAARPLKGPAYGTGRVALVDANGALDTVVGNYNDCVYVNGTSGPCFDPTQLPTYSDGETPAGVVDGSNANFLLAGTPSPVQSLILFRNGMAQKQGLDFTLSGVTMQFPTTAVPQPGDTLLAWYRLAPTAGIVQSGNLSSPGVGFSTLGPQVICSAPGSQTAAVSLAALGTCTIPANFLSAGDRVEIQFLFSHSGSSSGFTYALGWGSTTLLQRVGGTADSIISGFAEGAVTTGATLFSGASFGTVLPNLLLLASANSSIASPITIRLSGALSSAGTDSVSLANFTVIRYPAITNP